MKARIQLLDCSLRDGGYYTNWDFSEAFVEEYLKRMNELPIDYLEVGYRSLSKPGYLGAFFYSPNHILERLAEFSEKKLAIMLNAKDVSIEDLEVLLDPCRGRIKMVRLAVSPERFSEMSKMVSKLNQLGFEVALNLMYLSQWWEEPYFMALLNSFDTKPDFLYLVDSFGGMYPHQVEEVFKKIANETDIPLGFHAHNNLELALANSLKAAENGASILDGTMTGMGRGAGNLKTELLLTVLHNSQLFELDYDELSKAVSLFTPLENKYKWGTNLAYMVSGVNSLPQQEVMGQISKRFYSLNSIVRRVDNRSKGIRDNVYLKEFQPKESYSSALIVGGGPSGTDHAPGLLRFLLANRETCVIHTSSRNAAAFREFAGKQFHCLVGNEGHRLETVYVPLEESKKTALLPPFPRTMGTYIPPALATSAFELSANGLYISRFPESVTALAIESAEKLGVETLYFVGYDGYSENIDQAELELFQENEAIFEILKSSGKNFCALTRTKYSQLPQESVYSYL